MMEGNAQSCLGAACQKTTHHRRNICRGVDACIEKMLELVGMPLCHRETYLHKEVQSRGVLLRDLQAVERLCWRMQLQGCVLFTFSLLRCASCVHHSA